MRLNTIIVNQRAHQVQFAGELVIHPDGLLAIIGPIRVRRVEAAIGRVGRREYAGLQNRRGGGTDQIARNDIAGEVLPRREPGLRKPGDRSRVRCLGHTDRCGKGAEVASSKGAGNSDGIDLAPVD